MAFWNRNVDKPTGPPAPPPPLPEVEELAELIPELDRQEVFLWQPYVDRIILRFDGLPAPDGGGTFVRACLAAGCKAVPVIHLSTLWEKDIERREWSGRFESDLATRVRLGLFFAASLRYLVHALCRLRVKTTKDDWHLFRSARLWNKGGKSTGIRSTAAACPSVACRRRTTAGCRLPG